MKILTSQIAATPTIRGEEAWKIWEEAHRKPSKESEEGAKRLQDFFGKMMVGYDTASL